MRVLLVEDNADLAANIGDYFDAAGHVVDFARDGRQGLAMAEGGGFDAIVLDLALPRIDGLDVCRRLRSAGAGVPVLMLTARDALADRLQGFDAGTDDYLVKPFSLEELLARLTALYRRASGAGIRTRLCVRDLVFDPGTRRGWRGDRELELAPAQQRLLERLMRNAGDVVARADLEAELWQDDPPEGDVLRAHIHLLRSAIDRGHDVKLLQTVRGVGYRLADPDAI